MEHDLQVENSEFEFNNVEHTNVIEFLPDYVCDLIEMMELDHKKIQDLEGEQINIINIDNDNDILVYLCSIAERVIFHKKLSERIDDVLAPRKEAFKLQRQRTVSAFVEFFS